MRSWRVAFPVGTGGASSSVAVHRMRRLGSSSGHCPRIQEAKAVGAAQWWYGSFRGARSPVSRCGGGDGQSDAASEHLVQQGWGAVLVVRPLRRKDHEACACAALRPDPRRPGRPRDRGTRTRSACRRPTEADRGRPLLAATARAACGDRPRAAAASGRPPGSARAGRRPRGGDRAGRPGHHPAS